jgi:hypothetical protein
VFGCLSQPFTFSDPVFVSRLRPAAGGGGAPFGGLVSTNNLLAHWRMNEESGTRVDVHRAENLTDNFTVGFAAGKLGNAADFIPANTEFLSRANDADQIGGDTDYTITGWVRPDSTAADFMILSMWSSSSTNNSYRLNNSFGTPVFYIERNGADERSKSSSTNMVAGTAYFFAVGHSVATDELWISMNGGAKQTASTGGAITVTTTEQFRIGAQSGASPFYFDGWVDSVSWFREDLSITSISNLYNLDAGRDY